MDVIHKHPLGIPGQPISIDLPLGTVPLHVERQGTGLCLWVRRPEQALTTKPRTFLVVGTGARFPQSHTYIGTCLDGSYVWHVLEVV